MRNRFGKSRVTDALAKMFPPKPRETVPVNYIIDEYPHIEQLVIYQAFMDGVKEDIYLSQAKKIFNTEEPNKLQRSAVKLAFLHIGYGPQEPTEIALEQVAKANYRNLLAGDV